LGGRRNASPFRHPYRPQLARSKALGYEGVDEVSPRDMTRKLWAWLAVEPRPASARFYPNRMNLKTALLGLITLVAGSAAHAQLVELVTESPLTVTAEFTVPSVTTTATSRVTATTRIRLTQKEVIENLQETNIIPSTGGAAGWRLVAVQAPPSDLAFVNADFKIYAINTAKQIFPVPNSVFGSASAYSVENYNEQNIGQYVLKSTGTVTNYATYSYRPTLNLGSVKAKPDEVFTSGFASLKFEAKDSSPDHDVFFYAISSFRVSAIGSYKFNTAPGNFTSTGLVTFTLNTTAAKLVEASNYPEL
jgi:hypothetical protein